MDEHKYACDGCGHEGDDDEWFHVFDHPLKQFGRRDAAGELWPEYQEPVTCCGFCYASVVGSRLAQYPDQCDVLDRLCGELTRQNNVLREIILGARS